VNRAIGIGQGTGYEYLTHKITYLSLLILRGLSEYKMCAYDTANGIKMGIYLGMNFIFTGFITYVDASIAFVIQGLGKKQPQF